MALGPRRPAYYISVLALGFVFGGFLSALLKLFLPEGPAKDFFTFTQTVALGPVSLNLLIFSVTLGPLTLQISLLGLVGIAVAYLLARSLF